MPRAARIKSPVDMYHVMSRSISEISLFRDDEDRDKYLQLLSKYKSLYIFKVYAYCLMTTHIHLIIDCGGSDISKIMKSINQCYASYYNRKYNRHGHVFQDRFKSKVINSDRYLKVLSAYIHSNPSNAEDPFKILTYKYSSLSIYLGKQTSPYEILDCSFVLKQFGSSEPTARKAYLKFIMDSYNSFDVQIDLENYDFQFENESSQYIDGRFILFRDVNAEEIINFIQENTGRQINMHFKYKREHIDLKSICIVLLRSFCDLSLKSISHYIGNMTYSNIQKLCERGYKLIYEKAEYKKLVNNFLFQKTSLKI
jgi:putative transposase